MKLQVVNEERETRKIHWPEGKTFCHFNPLVNKNELNLIPFSTLNVIFRKSGTISQLFHGANFPEKTN